MRSDRYKKDGNHFRRETPNRRRRILLVVLFVALIAGVVAEMWVLLTMTTIDKRFTRSVERGLYAGWDLDVNETQLQTTGRITDTGFIDAELDAISEYAGRKYKDDDLAGLAREYITALKDCSKAAKKHDPSTDFDGFWSAFSEPYGRRVRAIYKMHEGEYDFGIDNPDYTKESSALLSQGWLLETISGLSFRSSVKDGVRTFETGLRNDSGSDIEYLNIDIELLDKDNQPVETSSVYLTEIKAGDMMSLRFISTSDKGVRYRIVSETFKFSPPAEEQPQ